MLDLIITFKEGPPPPETTRVWHDNTGRFRVEAAFLGVFDGKLRLHKVNGVVIDVPAEKMSEEDIRIIDKLTKGRRSPQPPTKRSGDDDDTPLAVRRDSLHPESTGRSSTSGSRNGTPTRSSTTPAPKKKGPTIDWFEFFLNAGCDLDDCTRYASAFERDKMDETILPDITEATMRLLGLREGDIIRVKKAIEQRHPKSASPATPSDTEQIKRDEELARALQAEDGPSKSASPAPNLFAGPGGALKTARRGRPQPSKSTPPSAVDINAISSASEQIQRVQTPQSPVRQTSSPAPALVPQRTGSAVVSGFDDDAWTNRPSSTKPTPTPAAAPARAPSAPPAPPPAPAQTQVASPPPTQAPAPVTAAPAQGLAKTTESDIFDQLARLSQLKVASPPAMAQSPSNSSAATGSPSVVSPPPASYGVGMGMGPSPVPMGQHLQAQQTGMYQQQPQQLQQNGPRGPFAPVPANQGLLQPLIPTTTGFNGFMPTRASTTSPFQSQQPQQPQMSQFNPQQPSFLSTQPTGFVPPQQTGFNPTPSPLTAQPTGYMGGVGGGQFGGFANTPQPVSSFQTGAMGGSFGGGLQPREYFFSLLNCVRCYR